MNHEKITIYFNFHIFIHFYLIEFHCPTMNGASAGDHRVYKKIVIQDNKEGNC